MRITIIGAGAMGSLFGGLLTEAGADVQLLDIWKAHVAAINGQGLRIDRENQVRTVRVKAASAVAEVRPAELAIVFVKSMHTKAAAAAAARIIGTKGYVLTLQNGMGNIEQIKTHIAPSRIIAGTTSHGATLMEPGKIRHAGEGPTTIGFWHEGDKAVIQRIAEHFTAAGIETTLSANIKAVVWDKLLVNVGINAVTALTGIKNGQLLDLPATQVLVESAVKEALLLAGTMGVRVRENAAVHVFDVADRTADNRSSMGQDVDRRRRTEIDAINGFVAEESEKRGLSAPVNRTLTALIETMQYHYQDSRGQGVEGSRGQKSKD
jgi:2-dehydropantoate 2-reductase